MSFHAQDGWYFKRLPDGSVHIRVTNGRGAGAQVVLDPDTWSSAVASVSHGDEEGGRFYLARQFHMGGEVGCECSPHEHESNCVLGIGGQ